MTDKEWKELCEWAESLKNDKVEVIENIVIDSGSECLIFDKSGNIHCLFDTVAYNRTPAQIKSIIENLL